MESPTLGLGQMNSIKPLGITMCKICPKGRPEISFSLEAVVLNKRCSDLPTSAISTSTLLLQNMFLADPQFNIPNSVDMLLGVDILPSIMLDGKIPGKLNEPKALNTIFGWAFTGKTQFRDSNEFNCCLAVPNSAKDYILQKFWELENIPNCSEENSVDVYGEHLFKTTNYRNEYGRYTIRLPFKERIGSYSTFAEFKTMAIRRLRYLENCLERDCLEGIPRKAYYLATKVGRYEKDPKLMFDFSAEKTKKNIDSSLKRLGLEYVDILQVHDIEFASSMEIIFTETLPTIYEEIVKIGKAKFIGITGYPVSTLLECVEKSPVKIDTVLSYCRMTMIDNTLQSFIPSFKMKKVGIINAAANSMGLLSNAGPPHWHPASQHIKDISAEAREYCKKKDVELGKLAVYHCLQQEGPDTVLVGMNSTKLLEYNLNVLNGLSQKENEAYEEVIKIFSRFKETHWEKVEIENYWKTIRGGTSTSGFF
ncbi:hypothetical protein NQ314_008174 [Rhamnusium bicolor]|uniref:NADP-dependent oxidoreductase domain-containing protein n=1 Tax=Rhamnusium bicolor TaxID=1586634 RepID=A0AAV8YD44_9CUCU|nr:hypothetical protein NQ314_008174 [Rhamnusium bicolor]